MKMKRKKLIDKKVIPQCEYCRYSDLFAGNENQKLCKYKGIVSPTDKCLKFKYDILKRTPQTATLGNDYNSEDFVL